MSYFVVWMKQMMFGFSRFIDSSVKLPWNETITQPVNTPGEHGEGSGVTPAMCRNAAPMGKPEGNELLLMGFSFLREKLCVARLQREVAQSKSEGAMVSSAYSLLWGSCGFLSASGMFGLVGGGHQSIQAVLDTTKGWQWCVHKNSRLGFLGKAMVGESCFVFLLMVLPGIRSKASTERQCQIKKQYI